MCAIHDFGKRVGQSACAYVMDRQDRVGIAQRAAAVDDFLRASLNFGVAALHRVEIKFRGVAARTHARGCAAPQTDAHARSAQLNQQ